MILCCRAANCFLFAVLHLVPLEAHSAGAGFLLYIDKKRPRTAISHAHLGRIVHTLDGELGHRNIGQLRAARVGYPGTAALKRVTLRQQGCQRDISGDGQLCRRLTVQIQLERSADGDLACICQQLHCTAVVGGAERVVEGGVGAALAALRHHRGHRLFADRAVAVLVYRRVAAGVAAGACAVVPSVVMLHDLDVAYTGKVFCITVLYRARVFICIRIAVCQQVGGKYVFAACAADADPIKRAAGELERDVRAGVRDILRRAARDGDRADGA